MLVVTYTPRADSASRGYEQWLRDVDNPFFSAQPGIVLYENWKVLEPLNLPWVVYEQDRSDEPPGEAAAISRRHLKQALGI